MNKATCKTCSATKSRYSAENLYDWMIDHYRAEHGVLAPDFNYEDHFMVEKRS